MVAARMYRYDPPQGTLLANFAPNSVFSNLAGVAAAPCKVGRHGNVPAARCSDRSYAPVCSAMEFEAHNSNCSLPAELGWKG
jgi:hypothetical protein